MQVEMQEASQEASQAEVQEVSQEEATGSDSAG